MFPSMSGWYILVAATDEGRARALATILRDAGHTVEIRADGSGVLDRPEFDVVVLDLRRPGMDRGLLARALAASTPDAPPESLETVERRHIEATLRFTGGNKRRAALLLGIARSTLIQKVRRYDIRPPDDT